MLDTYSDVLPLQFKIEYQFDLGCGWTQGRRVEVFGDCGIGVLADLEWTIWRNWSDHAISRRHNEKLLDVIVRSRASKVQAYCRQEKNMASISLAGHRMEIAEVSPQMEVT